MRCYVASGPAGPELRTVPTLTGMALFHAATLTPTKAELIAAWAPTQPWGPTS